MTLVGQRGGHAGRGFHQFQMVLTLPKPPKSNERVGSAAGAAWTCAVEATRTVATVESFI
ncbi:hypothetical protein BCR37DRAFT_382470, partial [Protomyces lactucae-debilis]